MEITTRATREKAAIVAVVRALASKMYSFCVLWGQWEYAKDVAKRNENAVEEDFFWVHLDLFAFVLFLNWAVCAAIYFNIESWK